MSNTNVTKRELVGAIAAEASLTQKQAEAALDALVGFTTTSLSQGRRVSITNLGVFAPKEREARAGRNPQTGKEITIAARTAVTFKPSTVLKTTVNQ